MNKGCGASRGTLKSGGIASNEALRYSKPPSCRINSSPYCDIWSSRGLGKKQGVSETWNCTGAPQRSSINFRKAWYFSGVKFELNCCRRAGIMIWVGTNSCVPAIFYLYRPARARGFASAVICPVFLWDAAEHCPTRNGKCAGASAAGGRTEKNPALVKNQG